MEKTNRNINWSPTVIFFAIILALGGVGVLVTKNVTRVNPAPISRPQPTLTIPLSNKNPEETSLKQGTFTFETQSAPAQASVCGGAALVFDDEGASSNNSNIFIALDPPNGQAVGTTGQIRAWVSDEAGGKIPPSVNVDSGGVISTHSNPLTDKDSHGYPWEPAIYLTLLTPQNQNGPFPGDKENGGTPIFPTAVKGRVTPQKSSGWLNVPTHDDPLPYRIGNRQGDGQHVAEFIWNVTSLGLSPGNYRVQVALHDGDDDLAIECTTFII